MRTNKITLTAYSDGGVAKLHNRRIFLKETPNGEFMVYFKNLTEGTLQTCSFERIGDKISKTSIRLSGEAIESLWLIYSRYRMDQMLDQMRKRFQMKTLEYMRKNTAYLDWIH